MKVVEMVNRFPNYYRLRIKSTTFAYPQTRAWSESDKLCLHSHVILLVLRLSCQINHVY